MGRRPQGDFLHVPQGGPHAFRNDSDAPREEYFEQVSQLVRTSEEERAAFFDRHDSYFVE
ncbi:MULTISPECIES: hypothetical protein [unclassified Nocardiopsis]|uniref:hypothetical protein n=1 Tax=unclassified Nocardiopsis TaxID=2649073 RepID=UPI0019166E80|nr:MULTISPECIES: hypothetical protein [unclassified Nocardiopsis]